MASGLFKIVLRVYAFTRSNWGDLGESVKCRNSVKSYRNKLFTGWAIKTSTQRSMDFHQTGCELILWRSDLGLFMGKFRQSLIVICPRQIRIFFS